MRGSLSTREVRRVQAFFNSKLRVGSVDVQFQPGPGDGGDSLTIYASEVDRAHAAGIMRELSAAALQVAEWLDAEAEDGS